MMAARTMAYLDASISYVTDFLAVELLPLLVVEALVQGDNKLCIHLQQFQKRPGQTPSTQSHLIFAQKASYNALYARARDTVELLHCLSSAKAKSHRTYHVDKCITDIAFILEVDRQIEEVICAFKFSIDGREQHLLRVLIWDIFYHQGTPWIFACTPSHHESEPGKPPAQHIAKRCKQIISQEVQPHQKLSQLPVKGTHWLH